MVRPAAAFAALTLLFTIGCTLPRAAASGPETCEAKVVRAMVSPNKPVSGAYACFDSTDMNFSVALAQAGITDDTSLAAFAGSDPAYTSAKPCPKQPDPSVGHIYELSQGSNHQAMLVHVAANGKVDQLRFAGMQSDCASVGAA